MKSFLLCLTFLLLSLASAQGQINPDPQSYKVILNGAKNSTIPLTAKKSPNNNYIYSTSGNTPPQGVKYRIDINSGVDASGLRYIKGTVTIVVINNGSIIGNVQYDVNSSDGDTHVIRKIQKEVTKKNISKEEIELLNEFVSFDQMILKTE